MIASIAEHTNPADVLCILHWFSGSNRDLERAVQIGCYFSVNSAMLQNERGRALIKNIPENRLLTESDAPFAKVHEEKLSPLYTSETMEQIARLRARPRADLKRQILLNSIRVFQFAGIELPNGDPDE